MKNGPYILVIAPDDYPGKKYRDRYVYEHHLIWWKNTGEIITGTKFAIHHKDENKHNNLFSNLEKLTVNAHTKHHAKLPAMICLSCDLCSKQFTRKLRFHKSNGYEHKFCSRSCQVKFQWKFQNQKQKMFTGL